MKITILCVGKIKEKFYKDAIEEYSKRLSKYCKLEIIEVSDEKTPDKASELSETQIKEKESLRMIQKLKDDAYIFTLEIEGKKFSSESFSKELDTLAIKGKSHICSIIVGSLGLHKSITDLSNQSISFYNMTFSHQWLRLILCEQIYRALRIKNGEPYHK